MSHLTSLQSLIREIDNPGVIHAQLTLLEKVLEQDQQLNAEVIVATVAEKMAELTRSAATAATVRERCRTALGEVTRATERVSFQVGSVLNVLSASDYGTALYEAAKNLHEHVSACAADIENIEHQLHEFDFDELALNLRDIHAISNRLKASRAYSEPRRQWLTEKFRLLGQRLQACAGNNLDRQLLPMAAETYLRWRQVPGCLAHLAALKHRSAQIVPEQLTKLLDDLHGSIELPLAHLHNCINVLGQHQQQLLAEKRQIEVVLVVMELLSRIKGDDHEEQQGQ